MPTKEVTRYKVTVPIDAHASSLAGFLDMLRYEGARVVTWDRTAYGFVVTLVTETRYFQPDRWASFLIPVEVIS